MEHPKKVLGVMFISHDQTSDQPPNAAWPILFDSGQGTS
jgi:hypothetical protein